MKYAYRYRIAPNMTLRGEVEAETLDDATWQALDTIKEAIYLPVSSDNFSIGYALSSGNNCAHLDLHRTNGGIWTCEKCGAEFRFVWHKQSWKATVTITGKEQAS